jgi:hypothetical protein
MSSFQAQTAWQRAAIIECYVRAAALKAEKYLFYCAIVTSAGLPVIMEIRVAFLFTPRDWRCQSNCDSISAADFHSAEETLQMGAFLPTRCGSTFLEKSQFQSHDAGFRLPPHVPRPKSLLASTRLRVILS